MRPAHAQTKLHTCAVWSWQMQIASKVYEIQIWFRRSAHELTILVCACMLCVFLRRQFFTKPLRNHANNIVAKSTPYFSRKGKKFLMLCAQIVDCYHSGRPRSLYPLSCQRTELMYPLLSIDHSEDSYLTVRIRRLIGILAGAYAIRYFFLVGAHTISLPECIFTAYTNTIVN